MANTNSIPGVIRDALQRARTTRQMKPVQLARRMAALGYPWHPQTVSNVESGRRRIPAEELLALALCLEVPVTDLLKPDTRDPMGTGVVDIDPPGYHRNYDTGPGTAEGLIPGSVAIEWIGFGDNPSWLEWVGDRPLWPTRADLDQRLALDQQVALAAEAREEAHDAVSFASQEHAKAVGLDESDPRAVTSAALLQRARQASQDAMEAYMAALGAIQHHRVQVRERLRQEARNVANEGKAE